MFVSWLFKDHNLVSFPVADILLYSNSQNQSAINLKFAACISDQPGSVFLSVSVISNIIDLVNTYSP